VKTLFMAVRETSARSFPLPFQFYRCVLIFRRMFKTGFVYGLVIVNKLSLACFLPVSNGWSTSVCHIILTSAQGQNIYIYIYIYIYIFGVCVCVSARVSACVYMATNVPYGFGY
jgi:hypothetical protein